MKKKTFVCDESMVITIPIGRDREEQLMPEKFYCVFRDAYKVFALKGKPKPLGAAQAITGVFLLTLGLVFNRNNIFIFGATVPSVLFVICGMLSFSSGQFPNMLVTKLSFFLNILSFLWSIAACSLCIIWFLENHSDAKLLRGVNGLILGLLAVEDGIAIFLMYWLSKAVCRDSFNSLPTILLKQKD